MQKDSSGDNFIPLVIAGGGGGMSFRVGSNAIKANGGLTAGGNGMSAATPPNGPGEITQWPIEKKLEYVKYSIHMFAN